MISAICFTRSLLRPWAIASLHELAARPLAFRYAVDGGGPGKYTGVPVIVSAGAANGSLLDANDCRDDDSEIARGFLEFLPGHRG